jgi:phospholipid/cholesterol/gamma-HCH transport system substrate-binding protein
MSVSERGRRIRVGIVSVVVLAAIVYTAFTFTHRSFPGGYELTARFTAAGQGLQQGSDVEEHGLRVGVVKRITLSEGRALVTMRLQHGFVVPTDSRAVIRPKTLFGEKYVDIEPGTGPALRPGAAIASTASATEVEALLGRAAPLLQAVSPNDLSTVLDTLATAARGNGPAIRRQLQDWTTVANVFAKHAGDTGQFLDDLDRLSQALAKGAPDFVAAERNLNVALPPLNAQGDNVGTLLSGAAALSRSMANVFSANEPALKALAGPGTDAVAALYDNRQRLIPLIDGTTDFVRALAEIIEYQGNSFTISDGSKLAAVKIILGGGSPCGRVPSCVALPSALAAPKPVNERPASAPPTVPGLPLIHQVPLQLPVSAGTLAIVDILGSLLGGGS